MVIPKMTDREKPTMCRYCGKPKPERLIVYGSWWTDEDSGWLISWDDISVNNIILTCPDCLSLRHKLYYMTRERMIDMIWKFDYSKQPETFKKVLLSDGYHLAIGYLVDTRDKWEIVAAEDKFATDRIVSWCRIPVPPVMEEYLLYKKIQGRGMDEIITRPYK